MIPEVLTLIINLIVLILASTSLGFVNKCNGDLTIVKNTNYFLIVFSIIFMILSAYLIYGEQVGMKVDISKETIDMFILMGGIILFQFGLIQYAVLNTVKCNDSNLENCYRAFMVMGILLLILGTVSMKEMI